MKQPERRPETNAEQPADPALVIDHAEELREEEEQRFAESGNPDEEVDERGEP
jgi:hypothetical protein